MERIFYSPFFFEDELECESSCSGDEMCEDLTSVDFGACAMYMGIAFVNGSCQGISGCGYIVNDVDYSPYFFENMQDCQSNCDSCIDPGLIDPLALCIGDYLPVCGCDSVTYWNGCIAMTQYGVSSFTDGACDCLNPNVPQDMGCFDIFEPVCGCNNLTYGNECYAYLDGVTSWTPGECKGNSVEEGQELDVLVYPNPVKDVLNIELSNNGLYSLELFDSQGRLVYSQRALLSRCEIKMDQFSRGTYVLRVSNELGEQVVRSIVK
ncbi:MAG: T9SS type A sorting domain-containing protein [Flavobacteriales bacterium]